MSTIDLSSLMNPPQAALLRHMRELEKLARGPARRYDASATIFKSIETLASALDELAVPLDEDGNKPERSDAWKPYEAVERWILREGYTTGSARDMGVCYLAHLLGAKVDYREIYRGNLDEVRERMVTTMLAAPVPVDFPRWPFWRICWLYEETLRHELERQGQALK